VEEFLDANNSKHYYEIKFSPIKDAQGNIIGALNLGHKIDIKNTDELEVKIGQKRKGM
jgi:hypothetical protein